MHGQISRLDRQASFSPALPEAAVPQHEIRRLSDGSIDRKFYIALSHRIRRETWRRAFRALGRWIAGAVRAVTRRTVASIQATAQWIDAGCRPL